MLEEVGLVVSERRGRSKLHWFDGAPLCAITARWPMPNGARRPHTKKDQR